MPELPEVETVCRSLRPHLEGRTIREARFASRFVMRDEPEQAAAALRGRRIETVGRHGKFLLFELSGALMLSIHLGMTGRLIWEGAAGPYTRAVFHLDAGTLVFDDIRQFGRIELDARRAGRLGPDALALTEAEFLKRLAARRGRIKPLLLNQAFLGGVGNIYADETLFGARIHPLARAERLSGPRARRLYRAMRQILDAAVASGGSSISNYVDGEGRAGEFQLQHRVYGREGEPCVACGAPVRRIVVAGRGTHYCPRCQRV
jgi:formamidopyrimidine-DNA glycosylase